MKKTRKIKENEAGKYKKRQKTPLTYMHHFWALQKEKNQIKTNQTYIGSVEKFICT